MTQSAIANLNLAPPDEYNQTLVANVHPADWVNPTAAERYDLVVIGAGTAGLVTAAGAAGLGARVALVEKHLMGGDCLNVGCVPSKCMIRSSRVVADVQAAKHYGVQVPEGTTVDFAAVMQRMRRLRSDISPNDSAQRFQNLGVDVFLGTGQFSSSNTITVIGAEGERTLRFKKAVIASGARASAPAIDGLQEASYLTNETVFNLTECPKRLAVIGAGPIGCELAQAFRRFGAEVVLFHKNDHILDQEDADAAEIVQQAFLREGIKLILNAKLQRVEQHDDSKVIFYETEGREGSFVVDEILVGAGRTPNVDGLNLEAVGVDYDLQKGIRVNDYLQTSNPRIYAAGDVCMDWKFTHAADAAARIVIKNTLFSPFGLGQSKVSSLIMPWATYTDPEIAHVGLYERQAKEQGIAINTFTIELADVDRAIADGETEGFVKIHVKQGTDQIVGATIVASHAGDLISEITVAMVGKVGLGKISGAIHPYPTQAEAIKKAADAYRRTLLTSRAAAFLKILMKLS
jgi:pyruvate/2-oxoglutarate dehydrogenase complex dihydrolipoamide dehydrogenase (E3) component